MTTPKDTNAQTLEDQARREAEAADAEARKLMDDVAASDLLGIGPQVMGIELRPITLASIALLMESGSDLIAGKPIEHCRNIIMDCCKFIRIQSLSLKDASRLVRNPQALEDAALEMADEIPPTEIQSIIDTITGLLEDATSTQVTPVPEKNKAEELTPDDLELGEG